MQPGFVGSITAGKSVAERFEWQTTTTSRYSRLGGKQSGHSFSVSNGRCHNRSPRRGFYARTAASHHPPTDPAASASFPTTTSNRWHGPKRSVLGGERPRLRDPLAPRHGGANGGTAVPPHGYTCNSGSLRTRCIRRLLHHEGRRAPAGSLRLLAPPLLPDPVVTARGKCTA